MTAVSAGMSEEKSDYAPLAASPEEQRSSLTAQEEDEELEMPGFEGLVGLYAIQVVSSFDNALVLPSMYLYVAKLSSSDSEANMAYGLAQTVYFACRVSGQIALGRVVDRHGRYRASIATCLALGIVGSAAYVLAPGVRTLIVGRGLLGLGSSVTVSTLSFVSTFVPKRDRTKLFATLMGLQRSSTPLAPLVVLGLNSVGRGRWVDSLNAPGIAVGCFNLAALAVVGCVFQEPPTRHRKRPPVTLGFCEVLTRTGAWVSYVLSFQNNWNNQVVVWTLPLVTKANFGASPPRDAFLFASGGFVGLVTAFALAKRKLCSTDRATIVAAQLGVGAFLAALASTTSCDILPISLPLLWCLFSLYYAPFIAQMPANNSMYSKLVSDYQGSIGTFQACLEVSKSSARAFAGLAIGRAYAHAGPCGLWGYTLALWAAQFLPLALVWFKLAAADPNARPPPEGDDALGDVAAELVAARTLRQRAPSLAGLLQKPIVALGDGDGLDASLNQGFVSPTSPTFIHTLEHEMI